MEKVTETILTPREQEIFNLLLEGVSSKDIIYKLNVTEKTLEFHKRNIFRKYGVKNSKELIEKKSFVPVFTDHTYDAVHLRANRWSNTDNGNYGQCYASFDDIKLRDFYNGSIDDLLPKAFDWYTVRISGTAEIELKYVKINLSLIPYGIGEWIYLGGGVNRYATINPGYFSVETQFQKIYNKISELPSGEILLFLVSDLFLTVPKNPVFNIDTGLRIPDNIPDHTVVTTIRNFKIEPVV